MKGIILKEENNLKLTPKKIAFVFFLLGIITCSPIIYVVAQTSGQMILTGGIYPGASSYSLWKEGSTYYCKNAYGTVSLLGTNAKTVIQYAWDNSEGHDIYLKAATYALTSALNLTGNNKGFYCERGTIIQASAAMNDMIIIAGGWNTYDFYKLDGNGNAQKCLTDKGMQYCTIKAVEIFGFTEYGYLIDTPNLGQDSIQNFVYVNNVKSTVTNSLLNVYIPSPSAGTSPMVQGNEFHFNFLVATEDMNAAPGFMMRVGTTGTANTTRDVINFNMFWTNLEANNHQTSCLSIASSQNCYQVGFIGGQTGGSWLTFESGTHDNLFINPMSNAAITGLDTDNRYLNGTGGEI